MEAAFVTIRTLFVETYGHTTTSTTIFFRKSRKDLITTSRLDAILRSQWQLLDIALLLGTHTIDIRYFQFLNCKK